MGSAQLKSQQVEFDFESPDLLGIIQILGIGLIPTVDFPFPILAEIEFLLEKPFQLLQTLLQSGFEAGKDIQGKFDISASKHVVQTGFVFLEFADVLFQEIIMSRVETVQVELEDLFGNGVIQWLLRIMDGYETFDDALHHRSGQPIFAVCRFCRLVCSRKAEYGPM